jgi:branched-chain amino acid transport system permease protein
MLQELINAVALGSIYLLFALGMSLAWGTINILNFAHGAIFMFSAFTGYLIVREVRLPMIVLVLIGMAVGAVMSVVVQVIAFQQIQKRAKDHRTAEMQILIGGIGIAAVILAIAQEVTKSNPFGFSESSFKAQVYTLGTARVTTTQIIIIVAGLALGFGMAYWLRVAKAGVGVGAVGVDSETASIMGINRHRLGLLTMAIAGALAGLAGVLLTFNLGAITPESGDTLLLKAFAAIILGGVGSMTGAVLGAYILAFAESIILTQTSGLWVDAVSFGLIFIVLLLRPQGILGRKEVRRT